jgi:hypothetical protein
MARGKGLEMTKKERLTMKGSEKSAITRKISLGIYVGGYRLLCPFWWMFIAG